jgi:hypothetical protein
MGKSPGPAVPEAAEITPRLFLMLAAAPGRSPRFFSASACISVMVLALICNDKTMKFSHKKQHLFAKLEIDKIEVLPLHAWESSCSSADQEHLEQ